MTNLTEILTRSKTIAIVGCSGNPSRTSYAISRYLIEVGYTVIPVNPKYQEIHGLKCYPDIQSIPESAAIDIVNIFRRPADTFDMVSDVLDRIRMTGEQPVIWTQLGVSSTEAEKLTKEAGLIYVKNRCIMVEHSRELI